MNIMSEIEKLPNLGYTYTNESKIGYQYKIVILGGNPCPKAETYRFGADIPDILGSIENIYLKKNLSVDDKIGIAKQMKHMLSVCEARTAEIHSIEQQKAYIDALSDAQKEELSELVSMYRDCYAIYQEYSCHL